MSISVSYYAVAVVALQTAVIRVAFGFNGRAAEELPKRQGNAEAEDDDQADRYCLDHSKLSYPPKSSSRMFSCSTPCESSMAITAAFIIGGPHM